jgi:predicted ester cyclase
MDKNRDLIRRFLEAFNRRDVDAAAGMVAVDLVNHAAVPEAQGRGGLFKIWDKLWAAFPDLAWTSEDLVAEGDRVVCRMRLRGVNSGALRFALMPLPPTGRAFDGEAIHIFRVADDKIVEQWAQRDEVGMLRQLGHLSLLR